MNSTDPGFIDPEVASLDQRRIFTESDLILKNKISILSHLYEFKDEFRVFLKRALESDSKKIELPQFYKAILMNEYDGDLEVVRSKMNIISHVLYMEQIIICFDPVYQNQLVEVTHEDHKYTLKFEPEKMFDDVYVIVAKSEDMKSSDEFVSYLGYMAKFEGKYEVTVSHSDGANPVATTAAPVNFAIIGRGRGGSSNIRRFFNSTTHADVVLPTGIIRNPLWGDQEVVDIYAQPDHRAFTAWQETVYLLGRNIHVQNKLFREPEEYLHAPLNPPVTYEGVLDDDQKMAVESILNMNPAYPFILYGPPGTGKTTTLASAVVALFQQKNVRCRILVCTGSNSAIDHFTKTLIHTGAFSRQQLLRIVSSIYDPKLRDEEINSYSRINEDMYYIPSTRVLAEYSIITSTVGMCHKLNVQPDFFTHLIFDEAGQLSECETMIPIARFTGEKTSIIFAGDPQQLQTVFTCNYLVDKTFNIKQSIMERYCKKADFLNNPRLMVQLKRNYRANAQINELYSIAFYNDSLIAVNDNLKAFFRGKKIIGKSNYTVRFVPVSGPEVAVGEPRSFYNAMEAKHVRNIVIEALNIYVSQKDIGVITPYDGQRNLIQTYLKQYPEIEIDSVERYQGREKRIIVLSTVRTESIGFLSDYKRLNTAISRAQELLVIFGNPILLSEDDNWLNLMRLIERNGGFEDADGKSLNDFLAMKTN